MVLGESGCVGSNKGVFIKGAWLPLGDLLPQRAARDSLMIPFTSLAMEASVPAEKKSLSKCLGDMMFRKKWT